MRRALLLSSLLLAPALANNNNPSPPARVFVPQGSRACRSNPSGKNCPGAVVVSAGNEIDFIVGGSQALSLTPDEAIFDGSKITATGDLEVVVNGNHKSTTTGNTELGATGTVTLTAGRDVSVTASRNVGITTLGSTSLSLRDTDAVITGLANVTVQGNVVASVTGDTLLSLDGGLRLFLGGLQDGLVLSATPGATPGARGTIGIGTGNNLAVATGDVRLDAGNVQLFAGELASVRAGSVQVTGNFSFTNVETYNDVQISGTSRVRTADVVAIATGGQFIEGFGFALGKTNANPVDSCTEVGAVVYKTLPTSVTTPDASNPIYGAYSTASLIPNIPFFFADPTVTFDGWVSQQWVCVEFREPTVAGPLPVGNYLVPLTSSPQAFRVVRLVQTALGKPTALPAGCFISAAATAFCAVL